MTVRRRQIQEADLGAVAELLARGFRLRSKKYWLRGFAKMVRRSVPPDYPRFGLLLENEGRIVGAILTIYSSVPVEGECAIRCNLSSWYLEPEFRSYAPLLASFRDPAVTYVNISPAPNTWATIEAQGFRCIREGWFLSFPALSRGRERARVLSLSAAPQDLAERALLEEHAALGCTCSLSTAGESISRLCSHRARFCTGPSPALSSPTAEIFRITSDLPARSAVFCFYAACRRSFSTMTRACET